MILPWHSSSFYIFYWFLVLSLFPFFIGYVFPSFGRLAMLEKLLLGAVQPRKQQPELASEEQSTLTTESPPLLLPQPPLQGAAGGGAPPHPIDTLGVDLAGTARATQGFSGSDVRLLCKEAAMKPVRQSSMEWRK